MPSPSSEAAHVTIRGALLVPSELEESLSFYCDVLGLEILNKSGTGDVNSITFGALGQSEMSIVLELLPADPGLMLATSDLDGTFERLEAFGAVVTQEPIRRSNGSRDCALLDPAGNFIRINEL